MGGVTVSIVLKDHATSASKPRNEDLFRHTQRQAMLLDGSTNLGLYRNMPDASWFVEEFSKSFFMEDPDTETQLRLAAAMDRVAQMCLKNTGIDPRTTNLTPSASLLLLEEKGDQLELYALGDCSFVVYYRDGRPPERFRDHRVDPFDGSVLAAMEEMAARTGMDILATAQTEKIRGMLAANRSKMNTPEGYWILAFSKEALQHLRKWSLPKEAVSHVLLFSDGFDWMAEDFLRQIPAEPLSVLCQKLRRMEEADRNCNRYPRFHTHDDACAALLEIK